MVSIKHQIQTSLGLNKMLTESVESAIEPQDPRDKMALRAARYTADLHKAMATLVKDQQHSAAYVLARPLVEASIAALYLLYAATEDKAAAMLRNDQGLPDAKDMIKKCRDIGEYGPNLEEIWSEISPFHKYTHGDTVQINRQSEDRQNDQEVAWLLFLSDVVTLAAFEVAAIALDNKELQNDVISIRDVSATLLAVRSGVHLSGRTIARLSPPQRPAQAQSSP
ncbi:hypothetical protein GGR75_000407 [Xanthomonas campestris]|uniref:DUF6988 family protein n=1 Tax=Xanthomonas campestris TaxID=339 RepID=UPI002B230AA0|nr:hypothetical protein [Xanthomonas campestris]MEA9911587.1 hypothetical protein [Xanthomonas campestris pv. raphani]MEC5193973.1 hypothetical protein [Xanthomonas campestris]